MGIVTNGITASIGLIRKYLAQQNAERVGQLEDLLNIGLDGLAGRTAQLNLLPGAALPFHSDRVYLFGLVLGLKFIGGVGAFVGDSECFEVALSRVSLSVL